MATENFYDLGERVVAHVTGLGDTNNFDITPDDFSRRNLTIETYVVGGSCDVKLLVDSGGDFSAPETNITLDSFSTNGITENAATPINKGRSALRITNTSGGTADFVAIGKPIEGDGD